MDFSGTLSGVIRQNSIHVNASIGKLFDIRGCGLSGVLDLLEVLGHSAKLFVSAARCRDSITKGQDRLTGVFRRNARRDQKLVCLYKTGGIKGGAGSVLFDFFQRINRLCLASQHVGKGYLILLHLGVVGNARFYRLHSYIFDGIRNFRKGVCKGHALGHLSGNAVKKTCFCWNIF